MGLAIATLTLAIMGVFSGRDYLVEICVLAVMCVGFVLLSIRD